MISFIAVSFYQGSFKVPTRFEQKLVCIYIVYKVKLIKMFCMDINDTQITFLYGIPECDYFIDI